MENHKTHEHIPSRYEEYTMNASYISFTNPLPCTLLIQNTVIVIVNEEKWIIRGKVIKAFL